MPLFVTLADGRVLDRRDPAQDLRSRCASSTRHATSRTVIIQVNDIPATLTGKKMEVPVRKLLRGVPLDKAANLNAMANPGSLDEFVSYAREAAGLPARLVHPQPRPLPGSLADRAGGVTSVVDRDLDDPVECDSS